MQLVLGDVRHQRHIRDFSTAPLSLSDVLLFEEVCIHAMTFALQHRVRAEAGEGVMTAK